MKKSEFVAEVAKKIGMPQNKTNELVNAILEVITDTLKTGDKVTLTGFGTFEARKHAERKGRDIRTKATITIPASTRPVFTAGAVLKEAVHPKAEAKAATAPKSKKAAKAKVPA
jgi:DNA-binding protein HU-beta